MTPQDIALKLAVLRVLVDGLTLAGKTAGEELKQSWTVGDRNAGKLPDGTVIGSVVFKNGATRAAIDDRESFEAWVRLNHPDEWETVTPEPVTRVRPAFEALLLNAAKRIGAPVDATTGEVVPGVKVTAGAPHPAVTLSEGAADNVAAAWQSGELSDLVSGLLRPAIEGGA